MLKLLKMENSALSLEKKSFVDIELLDGGVDATTTVAAAALGR